ncbi:hypothetical protein L2E82_22035 [Cichorium intybus]|uniref:Uncharacterized protein n=1 Tax=Cichorium intybus TaxID=13427 RepID=A0ACB9DXR4_CICIN|nr:hypothetical protein L2E82_22035 [Cichorium intybus]
MANSGEVLCVREKEKRKRERGGDCRRRSHWRDDDEDERILPLSLSFSCCVYKHRPRERVKKRRARLAHTDDCSDDALSITQFHPKLADSEHMTATAIISLPGRRRFDPVAMSPSTDNSGKF